MSPIRLVLLEALALGCSSSSFEVASPPDGATDAAAEASSDAGSAADAASASDAGGFECRDPSTCGDARPHCCASFKLGPGSLPSCPMSEATTKCQAVCATQIPLSCPSPGQVKVCRTSADCATDTANPKCCKIFASGMVGSVCVNDLVSSYAISCD